jgi:hypothetical protein
VTKRKKIDDKTMLGALYSYYNRNPDHPQVGPDNSDTLPPLLPFADIHESALLDGRRITPTDRSRRNIAGSSLIQVRFGDGRTCAGEVRAILLHRQPEIPSAEETPLIMVAWMKESEDSPLDGGNAGFVWNELCVSQIISGFV